MWGGGVDDQASGLRRLARQRPTRVVSVASGKGGVGKTSVTVNLAAALARHGNEVMIMDADLGLANVDVLLGLNPEYNLAHVVSGERSLAEVVTTTPGGVRVVPAASGRQRMAELTTMQHAGIVRAFSDLSLELDFLLVDTAAGISDSVITFSKASQEVIVVVCDEPASITDAYALIKVLSQDHGVERVRVLANMAGDLEQGQRLYEKIARVTDRYLQVELDFMGVVPQDEALRRAIHQRRPVVDATPNSPSAQAFGHLVGKVDGWPQPESAGQLEFFAERLLGHRDAALADAGVRAPA
ncbi:MAG: MinD/ParA family protein [Pseudomonadota bacterium]